MTEIDTVIVGTGFKGNQAVQAVMLLAIGDAVRLVRDAGNRHDSNAVAVHFLGVDLGFVPKVANPRVAAALDRGVEPSAAVTAAATAWKGAKGFRIKVEPKIRISWED